MDGAVFTQEGMSTAEESNITRTFSDYSKKLFAFIRRRVSNEADAEDILQDVLYQFIGNAQPVDQLANWLYTVARNKITDRNRKKKPELIEDVYSLWNDGEVMNWMELYAEAGNDPETEFWRAMFWEAFNAAIDELPEAQRQVFIWNELDGIPFKTIAASTGETVNTLISRKRYAVLHLRERLEGLRKELFNK